MRGQCLCGQIEFEIEGSRHKLYQCHCSLCRKQSGSLSNAATIVPEGKFRWLRGAGRVSTWQRESGFRSHFCSNCGSPVPNPLRDTRQVWIPAGLLENGDGLEIVAHVHLASRAPWDTTTEHALRDDECPDLPAFIALLQPID